VPEAPTDLVTRVLAGDARAAARLIRLVDDRVPGYLDKLKALHPHTGKAYVLGVTGTPGAGKSTLVDRLIDHYRAAQQKVGVLAVDPSSPFTGGAILGDRIRMQRHFLDEQVFIRSLATRGHLGGLSRSAGDVLRVLDAFGCDVVIVETVGVGQDELEIARLAHTTLVVMAPGGGDDIQAIKAGILEIADVFVTNKADRDGADATVRDLEGMLALNDTLAQSRANQRRGGPGPSGATPLGHDAHHHGHTALVRAESTADRWAVPVLKTVAVRGEGMAELVDACARHRAFLLGSEAGRARLAQRRRDELALIFRDLLRSEALERLGQDYARAEGEVGDQGADPYAQAEALLARVLKVP
jgi:LAO/AO transport system kinase